MSIHPTAIVSETAVIGAGSVVGPYALIEDGAVLGERCTVAAHAIVRRGAVLGDAVTLDGEIPATRFESAKTRWAMWKVEMLSQL
jgi:UDP-3-O-[3-hydroxymyristoyl] glucosamine N-acyltransferase